MTDITSDSVNHLRVKFNLKASVAYDFVQDIPNNKLQGLCALLDAFGASVQVTGRFVLDTRHVDSALRSIGDLIRKTMIKDPTLALNLDREITVELADDRNLKAFIASLQLGPYDDVINKKSITVETESYDDSEISQATDGGIIKPPHPPAQSRYVLE